LPYHKLSGLNTNFDGEGKKKNNGPGLDQHLKEGGMKVHREKTGGPMGKEVKKPTSNGK